MAYTVDDFGEEVEFERNGSDEMKWSERTATLSVLLWREDRGGQFN